MRELFRPAMLICLVMLVPIVPLSFLFQYVEDDAKALALLESWTGGEESFWQAGLILFLLLASDILLPVPSSVVNTLAGGQLGTFWGTLICWMGMNVGAIIGFSLGRFGGQRLALWFSNEAELDRTQRIVNQFGQFALIVVRGVPVLAEASVLLAGVHAMDWKKFLPPVMLANLVLAFTYAALGKLADDLGVFAISIVVAIVLPVILLIVFKRIFETRSEPSEE